MSPYRSLHNVTGTEHYLVVISHFVAPLGGSFGATLPFGAGWHTKSGLAQRGANDAALPPPAPMTVARAKISSRPPPILRINLAPPYKVIITFSPPMFAS